MEKGKIKIAVLFMSTMLFSYILIAPLLGEIAKSFPNATVTQIQLVYTIPSMISIPAMLIASKLLSRFSKKNMILVGIILVVISGLLPVLFNGSLMFLYFVSSLIGIGLGIVVTLSANVISDNFQGLECASVMGYQSAAISIGATIMSASSGKIATIQWSYSYLILLIFIPCIWIVFKFLPNDIPLQKSEKSKSKLGGQFIYFAFLSFLCGIFVTGYNTNIALFIQIKNLGGAEAAGLVNSICMLIGIPAGFIVGKLIKVFKSNIFSVAVASIAGGFFVTAVSTNMILVYIGAILIGFGFAVRTPSAITFAVEMVSADSTAIAISIVVAALNIGNFVSPIVINTIMKVFGNSISGVFIVCGICSVIIACLYLFTNPVKKKGNVEVKYMRKVS